MKMKNKIILFIIFVILVFVMTFPLATKMDQYIPGFYSTSEPPGILWESWRTKFFVQNHLSLKDNYLTSYPFGTKMYSSGFLSYGSFFCFFILSLLFTPAITYNFIILGNIFFSAIFAWLLSYHLTRDKISAFLSAIIFAFCPYQFSRLWQHFGLTFNEFLPLILLSLILLQGNFSRKNRIIFFFSALFLYSFDFHIMFFGSFIILMFCIYKFLYHWRKKFLNKKALCSDINFSVKILLLVSLVFIILGLQFWPIIKGLGQGLTKTTANGFNAFHRPFNDLFTQSAKPLSYFLPSTEHPVFGKFTQNFIGSSLWGISVTEHQLYLGWIGLILSFSAFLYWKKQRKLKNKEFLESNDNFYIGFFIFLGLGAWVMSQPPWWNIFRFKIYMPSFFIYKFLPMIRAYCRFGILVVLAVSILAGFGLKIILARKAESKKIIFGILICGLALFEFWNWPPFKVIDVSKAPAVYSWFEKIKGDFAIAEYPLDANGASEEYRFHQIFHKKPIINGTSTGTIANKITQGLVHLSEHNTVQELRWMGVEYVVVHRNKYFFSGLVKDREELEGIADNPGLKFIKSFDAQACPDKDIRCMAESGPIDVYEVVAEPKKPDVGEEKK